MKEKRTVVEVSDFKYELMGAVVAIVLTYLMPAAIISTAQKDSISKHTGNRHYPVTYHPNR
jgi:hypothetical protein